MWTIAVINEFTRQPDFSFDIVMEEVTALLKEWDDDEEKGRQEKAEEEVSRLQKELAQAQLHLQSAHGANKQGEAQK
jgi:hypothetical protein